MMTKIYSVLIPVLFGFLSTANLAEAAPTAAGFYKIPGGDLYYSSGFGSACYYGNLPKLIYFGKQRRERFQARKLWNVVRTLPADLRIDGKCEINRTPDFYDASATHPLPRGFYKSRENFGIYYSNGLSAYCGVGSDGEFKAMGGTPENLQVIEAMPIDHGWDYVGECGYNPAPK